MPHEMVVVVVAQVNADRVHRTLLPHGKGALLSLAR